MEYVGQVINGNPIPASSTHQEYRQRVGSPAMQSETRTKSAGLCEWTRNATHTPVDSIAIRAVQNGILNKKPGEPNENHRTRALFTGWLADVCKGSARVCAKNPVGVAQVVALDECAAATLNAVPGYPKDG